MHVVDDVELPAQLLPPPTGAGLLHDLERCLLPLPQVTEHAPYDPHDPHCPSTFSMKNISYCKNSMN